MKIDWKSPYIKVLVVIVAVVIIIAALQLFSSKKTDKAPDFTVKDIDGNIFTLSDYKDKKVVLIDFMATWCSSCKEEMKHLKEIYEKYGNKIEMISIDIDRTESEEDLRNFMEEYNAKWRAALDTDNVKEKYGITDIVRVVIVDKEGYITYSHVGVSTAETLSDEIEKAEEGIAGRVNIRAEYSLVGLAVGAGIFSFFSPCSFPLLPGYMSYYFGRTSAQFSQEVFEVQDVDDFGREGAEVLSEEERKRRVAQKRIRIGILSGIATALGIIALYSLVGLFVAFAGNIVKEYIWIFIPIVGGILVILGITMVEEIPLGGHIKNAWLYLKFYISQKLRKSTTYSEPFSAKIAKPFERLISRVTNKEFSFAKAKEQGYFGLFLFGLGYGAAAASCTAPIFIAVMLAALSSGGVATGFFIFFLYALSMGILMVIITLLVSMSKDTILNRMQSGTRKIELVGGLILEGVGLYLIWYYLNI